MNRNDRLSRFSQVKFMDNGHYKFPCDQPIQMTLHKGTEYEQLQMVVCAKCERCVKRTRRQWTGRLLLESSLHSESTFLTLTYDPANEQQFFNYRHIQDFFKLLRTKRDRGSKSSLQISENFRHFTIGETGDKFGRIHWHTIAFSCKPLGQARLQVPEWPYGFIQAAGAAPETMSYVAGYATKKMSGAPAFTPRMSQIPPIGAQWCYQAGVQAAQYNMDASRLENFYRVGNFTYPWDKTTLRYYELGLMDGGIQTQSIPRFDIMKDQMARLYPFWKDTEIESKSALEMLRRQTSTFRLQEKSIRSFLGRTS